MIKQCELHFGQGHILAVRWQPLLCQKGMGNQWIWPVQSSVPINWLRSLAGKIWLSRVHRKLWKVLGDIFNEINICHINTSPQPPLSVSCWENVMERMQGKVLCGVNRAEVDQRYGSECVELDQLYLLTCSSARLPLPSAAAQLAVLLISPWLKTLHVPWKAATQSCDIDRATLRWVFLSLPVCGSWTKDGVGGGGGALSWPPRDNT